MAALLDTPGSRIRAADYVGVATDRVRRNLRKNAQVPVRHPLIRYTCTLKKLWFDAVMQQLSKPHEFIVGYGEHVEVKPRIEHSLFLLGGNGEAVELVAALVDPLVHHFHEDDLSSSLRVFLRSLLPLHLQLSQDMLEVLTLNPVLKEKGKGKHQTSDMYVSHHNHSMRSLCTDAPTNIHA